MEDFRRLIVVRENVRVALAFQALDLGDQRLQQQPLGMGDGPAKIAIRTFRNAPARSPGVGSGSDVRRCAKWERHGGTLMPAVGPKFDPDQLLR